MIAEQNAHFQDLFEKNKLSAKALSKALLPMPTEAKKPTVVWCRDFVKRYGWSLLTASTEQQSLPFNHPDMILYRKNYREMIESGKIHPHLVLNFDQVWRCAFNWTGRMQWKERAKVGQRGVKRKIPKTQDKKRHAIRGARKSLTVPSCEYSIFRFTVSFVWGVG